MGKQVKRRVGITAPQVTEDVLESLCEIDENKNILSEYGDSVKFLKDIVPEKLYDRPPDKVVKISRREGWDSQDSDEGSDLDEECDSVESLVDYEQRSRLLASVAQKETAPAKLPIRDANGVMRVQMASNGIDKKSCSQSVDLSNTESTTDKVENPGESKKENTEQKLSDLEYANIAAGIATSIMTDPQTNLRNLKVIFKILPKTSNDCTKGLLLLTLLKIFKDIIPGYKILPTPEEKLKSISKEAKVLLKYEQLLLDSYKDYLQTLDKYLKLNSTDGLTITVIKCYGELLTTVAHFNYRINIITPLVSRLNYKDPAVYLECSKYISSLFESDVNGEATLEAVRLITRAITRANYQINPVCIDVFLSIRTDLDTSSNEEVRQKHEKPSKKEHLSQKARKLMKKRKEIESNIKVIQAQYNQKKVSEIKKEIVKNLFLTYFRILKRVSSPNLLSSAFKGISRFAHLISVDYFSDLINVTKEILNKQLNEIRKFDANSMGNIRSALQSVTAIYDLVSKQNYSLEFSMKYFNDALYELMYMHSVCQHKNGLPSEDARFYSNSCNELILECLALIFLGKRDIPIRLLMAFIKRLAGSFLHSEDNFTIAGLSLVHKLISRFSRLENMLNCGEVVGDGTYDPLTHDPDQCNAISTNLWEISFLKNHYHAEVREYAKAILKISSENYKSDISNVNPLRGFSGQEASKSLKLLYRAYDTMPLNPDNTIKTFTPKPELKTFAKANSG